ncbi:acyltransferase [Arcticibacterium luteifluviistationis]|uniref:Capsule biosynthesis protein CapG n=1 Tax=Arcticibacterium luteifluviistationis TaxID=1784714 RepID=A0A2Z4G9Y6_9BACT|nr:acyltransferase [Arcticibacterium luteifluviistationis]AWV98049.1 capsule biosynthesis protein CapG [Arcticibacterium luteifluviistationis]
MKKISSRISKWITGLLPLEKQAKLAGVKIGVNNFIASKFWGSEPYLIEIGNNCSITDGVKLFTHGGARAVRKQHPKFDCFGKVAIGNYVYIGTNSLIMPGVSIGDNVLVAAGSVVSKSIPSGYVVGGNPAKIICKLEKYIENNLQYNQNSKGLSGADKKALLLSAPNEKFITKNYMLLK